MKVMTELLENILKILARNPSRSSSLEELTMALFPNDLVRDPISFEREYQAQVLDALISLENAGMIVLNSDTDESTITLKGLQERKSIIL
ncbi:hypothetical protein NLG42_16435 [Flavobacterium plurextorum]|uniref:hypothetical protein n=1 Tax=Flavobacterium TaxID=237 RepID=UPI00214DCD34|nr:MULTISPECIES: hypothetical protein [Flavobacterium]UUW07683.1 hypothetical protein NLG42_16435 [Flavobacterium plurextorum]